MCPDVFEERQETLVHGPWLKSLFKPKKDNFFAGPGMYTIFESHTHIGFAICCHLWSSAVQENMTFTHRSDADVVLKVHEKAGSSCHANQHESKCILDYY